MKTENIIIRISERDKKLVKELSEERQMSMSEYIIHLVRIDAEKRKKR